MSFWHRRCQGTYAGLPQAGQAATEMGIERSNECLSYKARLLLQIGHHDHVSVPFIEWIRCPAPES